MKNKKLTPTEQLIHDIFRLCDKTVWVEDFREFQKEFEKILKKKGYNLWKIYFNVSSEKQWQKKISKSVRRYQESSKNKRIHSRTIH